MFKDIEQVLFYKNKKGEIVSCILYLDGTTKKVSRNKGEKVLYNIACKNRYKEIDDLIDNEYFNCLANEEELESYIQMVMTKKKEMKDNIYNFIDYSLSNEESDSKEKKKKLKIKFDDFLKKHPKISKFVKPAFKFAIVIGGTIAVIFGVKKLNEHFSSDKKIENNVDDRTNKNGNKSKHKENIGNYKSLNSAIENSNINSAKKSAVKSTWTFLKNYNKDVAEQYSNKKGDKKLAHKWNEVMSYYLAYNDIKQSDINKIFGKYKFNALKMINAYKDGIEQDIQAYSVLSSSLGKEDLIISAEGKNFYTDYEKMMIKFNSIDDSKYITRESVANEFYKKVKKDLLGNKNVKSYKLSVIPIVKTFNRLTKDMHFSEKLTKDEVKEINSLSSSVYSKFKKYERNLETNRMTDKALGNKNNEIPYSSLKNLGIRELRVANYYNVNEASRDITDTNIYTESVEKAKPTTILQSENKNDNVVTNNVSENTNNDSKEKKKKIKNRNTKKKKINSADFIPVNYNWIPADNNVDNSYNDDKSNVTILDYSDVSDVQISNSYVDFDGSIDSSVKDITTDATGAVSQDTELPDPNMEQQISTDNNYSPEVVANMIVNSMENYTSENTTNVEYRK